MVALKYKKRAVEIANSQGYLADSPAEINNNGNITLCAAACLAYAGIEIEDGDLCAEEFSRKLVAEKKKSEIIEVFKRFGWGSNFGNFIVVMNDKTKREQRIPTFIENIKECAS